MNKVLIFLFVIAIVLGVVAYLAVFTPGTYEFASKPGGDSGSLSFNSLANGTGTLGNASSGTNASGTNAFLNTGSGSSFASTYSYPYPISWNEGQNDFSVTGAAFDGTTLILGLKVQIGNVGDCIPTNVRLVTDETGDVEAPSQTQFNFPDTHSCSGTPNATYNDQTLSFTISPSTPTPWLFTTGGNSNQFFQVATTSDGGLNIQLPATSG